MKAIVYRRYGSAEVLKCEDIPKPVPNDDQVLMKVRAAALNPLDWRMIRVPRYTNLVRRCGRFRTWKFVRTDYETRFFP